MTRDFSDLAAPLPANVGRLLSRNTHPGLELDKYVRSCLPPGEEKKWSEKIQRPTIDKVVNRSTAPPGGLDFPDLLGRWQQMLADCRAESFSATTAGPLSLHLARASALENAGLCLHSVYGFAYLPGTGLKGMARAYAETVWFPLQFQSQADGQPAGPGETEKATVAWRQIESVFGYAPNSDRDKPWKPQRIPRRGKEDQASSGSVVFFDAWPMSWPKLTADIVNCHHSEYYGASEHDNEPAPGDWENPIPVYFLAVEPSSRFLFALARRRGVTADRDFALAQEWLSGALTYLGAGAKTAAGYGSFKLDEVDEPGRKLSAAVHDTWKAAIGADKRAEFSCTLELVTPAFLAGASREAGDCDLRPATLRGLLRWWWRTMHAGFVDVATLRKMEAAIWGDTKQGGAVRIEVERLALVGPQLCPGKKIGKDKKNRDRLDPDLNFFRENGIEMELGNRTPGLHYAMYGMDEMKTGAIHTRKQRLCLLPGSKWKCTLTARTWTFAYKDGKNEIQRHDVLTAEQVLDQARSALWLMSSFGGVGSKTRNGFGSFADPLEFTGFSLEKVRQIAKSFREVWQKQGMHFGQGRAGTHDLEKTYKLEIPTPWTNVWFGLHQVGEAMQSFAQAPTESGHGKHCASKAALGLPRRIHGPLERPLPHQKSHVQPVELVGPRGDRYAAPVLYHFAKDVANLIIRVLVFLPEDLWAINRNEATDRPTTHRTLDQLHKFLDRDLHERVKRQEAKGTSKGSGSMGPIQSSGRSTSSAVTVTVLERREHGGKVSFIVHEEGKPKGVLMYGTPPAQLPDIGSSIQVYLNSGDQRNPQYRWDQPSEGTQGSSKSSESRRPRSGHQRGRR